MLKDDYPFELAIESAKECKQMIVSDAGGPADGDPMVTVHRKGRVVAMIQVRNVTGDMRNDALSAARCAIVGWQADRAILIIEGFMREDVVLPDNGELPELERGELGEHFRKNADSDVVECIVVNEARADGRATMVTLPYHYGEGGALAWRESRSEEGDRLEGIMPEALKGFFVERDVLEQEVRKHWTGELPDDHAFHRDRAVANTLTSVGHIVMAAFTGECTCDD